MQCNQFSTHPRKKQTKSIVYMWLFNKILFRRVLQGREWENEKTFSASVILFAIFLLHQHHQHHKLGQGRGGVGGGGASLSFGKKAASMTCLVQYLSNNVNIVSPQLTIFTFHSNHDFSTIKWNVSYSIHSLSTALGNTAL